MDNSNGYAVLSNTDSFTKKYSHDDTLVPIKMTSPDMNGSTGSTWLSSPGMDGIEIQTNGSSHLGGNNNDDEGLSHDVVPKKRSYSDHLGSDWQALLPDFKSCRPTPSRYGYKFNDLFDGSVGSVNSPPFIDLTGEDGDSHQQEKDTAQQRQRGDLLHLEHEQALEDAYFAEQFPHGVDNHKITSVSSRAPSQYGFHPSDPMATRSYEVSSPKVPIVSSYFQDTSTPRADMIEPPNHIKPKMPGGWDFENDLFGEDPAGPCNDELFSNKAHIWDDITPSSLPTLSPRLFQDEDINPYLSPLTASSLAGSTKRTSAHGFKKGADQRGIHLPHRSMNQTSSSNEAESSKHIKDLLAKISTDDKTVPGSDRQPTPVGLQGTLYPHQQIALKWMRSMEDDKKMRGGLLADDMGLGKTITTLALILSNPSPRPGSGRANKTTLIVAPVSLIKQWEREIRTKVKSDHKLRVYNFHQQKISYDDIRKHDVVLTSYGKLRSELKKFDEHMKKAVTEGTAVNADASPKDALLLDEVDVQKDEALVNKQIRLKKDAKLNAELTNIFPFMGPNSMFHRVILDESQHIKNGKTQAAKAVMLVKARYRWCLSGTPFMNKVGELAPCIEFLRIRPYSNPITFKDTFGSIDGDKKGKYNPKDAMKRLQVLLKVLMLRRTKNSQIDGKPIIQLPPKTEVIDHVIFDQDENLFYRDLEREGRVMVSKYLRGDTTGRKYTQILLRLLRLRQACCHPFLHAEDLEWVEAASPEDERMWKIARSLSENVVKRIKDEETDGFQCPICFENISNPKIIVPCGHHICSECLVSLTHTTGQVNQQEGIEGSSRGPCPSCRQVVELKDTITYYIYQRVHRPESEAAQEGLNTSDTDDNESESEEDSKVWEGDGDDDEVDDHGNLKDFVVLDHDDDEYHSHEAKHKIKALKVPKMRVEKSVSANADFHKLIRLRKESNKNLATRRKYLRYLKETWRDSAKVTKCRDILAEIQKTEEKTIVFSQWTMLLDFVEVPVKYDLKLGYRRYDGSMSSTQRDNAVREFMEDPDVKVMLISIKAGNAGLNLVCASQVVIMDPFWNPYVEMQGVDRAHRIGQTRAVTVHRLLVRETVEDRIAELQEQKRQVIDTALDEKESMNISKLTAREVGFLFGLT